MNNESINMEIKCDVTAPLVEAAKIFAAAKVPALIERYPKIKEGASELAGDIMKMLEHK